MENQNAKSLNHYFGKAKELPLAMNFAQIQQVVAAKGVSSPPNKSWWNLNNIILMTTSIILLSAGLWLFNAPENNTSSNYQPYTTLLQEVQSSRAASLDQSIKTTELEPSATTETPEKQETFEEQDVLELMMGNPKEWNETNSTTTVLDDFSEDTVGNQMPLEETLAEDFEEDLPEKSNLGGDFEGKSKTIKKEFEIGGVKTLKVNHRNGNVAIETWEQNKIEVSATFKIKTKEPEDELLALSDFDISLDLLETKAVLKSNWDEQNNCSCGPRTTSEPKGWLGKLFYFPSKNEAKTDNGENLEYENFKIEYTIKIPKSLNVDVSNQFANVSVAEIGGDLDATLFRGDLAAGNVGGNLELNMKYGEAKVGNYQESEVNLFRSELNLGTCKKLDLKANYSEVEAGRVADLSINAFRSNLNSTGADVVEGNFRYGDLTFKQAVPNADIILFRSNLIGTSFDRLDLSASYSSLVASNIFQLIVKQGFRSDLKVIQVGTLKGSAQYSPIKVETLTNEVDMKLFRGSFNVEMVQADFTAIQLNAKYTDVDVHFSPDAKYVLDATTTYTVFNLPEEIAKKSKQEGSNSQTQNIVGTFNQNSSKQASKVSLEAFHGVVKLN